MGDLTFEMSLEKDSHHDRTTGNSKGPNIFLVPFFNFFYYIILLPFRIALQHDTNSYRLVSCFTHQIFCGISHFLVLLIYSYITIMFLVNMKDKEPTIILAFEFISNLSCIAAATIAINLFWRRKQDFLRVLECTRIRDISDGSSGVRIGILIYSVLFLAFVSIGALNYNFITEDNKCHSFATMSYDLPQPENETAKENDQITEQYVLWLRWFCHILIAYTSTFYLSVQGTLLVLSLSLRQLGKDFSRKMNKCQDIRVDEGIKEYRDLKIVCDVICRIFGNLLLVYYVGAVSYYAEAPHILLGKRGNTERFVLLYFVLSGVVWVVAAEFHHQIRNTLQKWIRHHTDNPKTVIEDRLKLLAISNEILNDPIAFSSKYFRVTYTHLGTMLGMILTYAIIVCQLYHGESITSN